MAQLPELTVKINLELTQLVNELMAENEVLLKKEESRKEEMEEVINLLHHWIHGDNMKSESIRFVREHGDKTIFR